MVRVACGFVLLTALSGCGDIRSTDERPDAVAMQVAFTDRSCREIALQRAADAAENGYDRDMQARVGRDSYQACLAIKDLHAGRAP